MGKGLIAEGSGRSERLAGPVFGEEMSSGGIGGDDRIVGRSLMGSKLSRAFLRLCE